MTRNPTCAHCGGRDATRMFDGKPSCEPCATPVGDVQYNPEPSLKERVCAVLKRIPEMTCSEICEALGVSVIADRESAGAEERREYDNVASALSRMTKIGVLSASDDHPRRYVVVGEVALRVVKVKEGKRRRRKKAKPRAERSPEEIERLKKMADAAKGRRRKRVEEHRCIDCNAGLEEGHTKVRCVECLVRGVELSMRWKSTARGKKAQREWYRRHYQKDVEAARRKERERRYAKKELGICLRCVLPALDDSLYCESHRDYVREMCRENKRRKRSAA